MVRLPYEICTENRNQDQTIIVVEEHILKRMCNFQVTL